MGWLRWALNFLTWGCCRWTWDKRYLKSNRIVVTRPPEPLDVYWENLGYGVWNQRFRIFLTCVTTGLLLLVAFAISLSMQLLKRRLADSGIENGEPWRVYLSRVIGILLSLVVTITNFILSKLIIWMSEKEKHETYTQLKKSIGSKMILAQIINTVIMPLAGNIRLRDWFTQAGLMEEVTINTLSTAFAGALLYAFDPGYMFLRVKRLFCRLRGDKANLK